uniref:Malonyl-CoA:ACP transacylase (MAT) domain-containing protein n=1 Tax=Megaselia scalaris TaxID=36166 RepID=T1GNG3_MEGSC
GCLSERQAILSAYFRGYSVNRELTIEGRIALIGLGREQLKTLIPEDCDDAAHLDENTSTIAGPKDSIEKFADVLQKQNHFVWVANASNVPFHTRYLKNAGKELLKNLDNIIQEAKLRSKNWYSTSVVQEEWSQPKAQLCSGSYYVHNLLGCVYFEETCKVLPPNCVIIGIAPMCFLRTSMKTNTPDSLYIPLSLVTLSAMTSVAVGAISRTEEFSCHCYTDKRVGLEIVI